MEALPCEVPLGNGACYNDVLAGEDELSHPQQGEQMVPTHVLNGGEEEEKEKVILGY